MTELKVYRWASTLIPGSAATAILAGIWPGWWQLSHHVANADTSEFVIFSTGGLLIAYVLGAMFWGVAYYTNARHFAPFLNSGPIRHAFRRRYQDHRLEAAQEELRSKHLSHEDFRLGLSMALECLKQHWGPRLAGQWEYIGLLQSLGLVAAVGFFASVLGRFGIPHGSFLDLNPEFFPPIALLTGVTYFGIGFAYSYRVRAFGRDLGLAMKVMEGWGLLAGVPRPPVLLVDFDGVIADANRAKFELLSGAKPGLSPGDELDRTSALRRGDITKDEYDALTREAVGEDVTKTLAPIDGVEDAFRTLSRTYRIVVASQRKPDEIVYAQRWLRSKNLARYVDAVVSSSAIPKRELAASLSAVAVIDDDERHLIGLAASDRAAIHFHRTPAQPEMELKTAPDWKTVLQLLEGFDRPLSDLRALRVSILGQPK